MADYLKTVIRSYADVVIDLKDRISYFPEQDLLPDAAYQVKQANDKKLNYNVQVNNLKYWQYHRNNGITKIGIKDPESNNTFVNIRTIEGILSVTDLIN